MIYQERSFQTRGMFFRTFYSTSVSGKRPRIQHSHKLPEIALVLSGSGIYEADRSVYPFKEGDVFFFAGNVAHYITQIDSDRPLLFFNLHFDDAAFLAGNNHVVNCLFCPAKERISTDEQNNISPSEIMRHIHDERTARHVGWEMQAEANVLNLLVWWMRYSLAVEDTSRPWQNNEQIMRAVHYISEHLTEDLRLDVLAREAGLSRTYFSSVFHAATGSKVWEYITRKRIDLAMQWLAGSDCSITEIALRCGFNHTASFYRLFRRHVGQGPSEFRKAIKATIEDA